MPTCPDGHTSQSTDYCDVCGSPMGAPAAASNSAAPASTPAPAAPDPDAAPCPNCGTINPPGALFCEACGYDYTTGTLPRTAAQASSLLDIDAPMPASTQPATPEASVPEPVQDSAAAEPAPAPVPPVPGPEAARPAQPPAAPAPIPTSEPAAPQPDAAPVSEPDADPADQASPEADIDTHGSAAPTPAAEAGTSAPRSFVAEVWIDPEWFEVQQSGEDMPSPGLPEVVALGSSTILIGRQSRSRNIHPEIDCDLDTGVSRRQAQLTTDGRRWWVEDLESANGTYVGPASGPLPLDPIGRGKKELGDTDRIYVGAWTRIVVRKATPDELQQLG